MAVRVRLATALREHAGGRSVVVVELPDGADPSLRSVLDALGAAHPGLAHRLRDERGRLRPHVNVFVGADNVRDLAGLATSIPAGAEVSVLPAVSGGCGPPERPGRPAGGAG